jgi:hypothetical protein
MGYELKKVMSLYGVQTPSMARYAGVEKPADVAALGDTATAEQRAQYAKDKAAFDEQMRRYNLDQAAYQQYTGDYGRNIGLGNIYNQAQFGFTGQPAVGPVPQMPAYSTPAETAASGFDYDAFAKANLPTWFKPDVYEQAVKGLQSGVDFGDYDITGRGRQGTLAINYGDFSIPTRFRDSRDIRRHADALRDMYNIYTTQQYAEGGEVQAYQQGGRQGDGITVRRIEDDPFLERAASTIDRVRAAERDVAPITIEDPFARENDLRALLEAYAPQADYSDRLADAEARRKAEFDAFANMIAGQANPEADRATKAEMYFRLAAAFGSPTKTGAFGENLALAAGEMAETAAARRESLAKRAERQMEAQKLRYQMAGEDLEAVREAQAAGTTGQRAIAQKLVEDYIASGKPQSEAGKIARDMGLQMGTPEYAAFVEDYTRTKMEKELAALQTQQAAINRMPAAMIEMKAQSEDMVSSLTQAMEDLKEAYALNPNSYSGSALDQLQYVPLAALGSDAPKVVNTRRIENLLGEQALGRLKATFGAAPTEGERKILMDLQGIGAKSLEERGEIMLRLYDVLQQRRDREAQRLQEIESGSYGVYDR